ncbi:MAG: peptidoglycan editing factor PgeF [Cyclonatronaceae bacterium]
MPRIWKDRPGIHAAFINREIEKTGETIRSVSDIDDHNKVKEALENNRRIASSFLNVPDLSLCMGKQVHGAHVACVNRPGVKDSTDGLVTDRPGLGLGILVADCAAILMADPVYKVVAAVHAGWRGAVDGIIPEAIRQMEAIGAEPDLLQVYLSPCISLASFEVGEEVAARFPQRHVDRSLKKPHVDLGGFLMDELKKMGVARESIVRDETCTTSHDQTLHSFRRDGAKSGRMMGIIALGS